LIASGNSVVAGVVLASIIAGNSAVSIIEKVRVRVRVRVTVRNSELINKGTVIIIILNSNL
jgi:hypothetical protein